MEWCFHFWTTIKTMTWNANLDVRMNYTGREWAQNVTSDSLEPRVIENMAIVPMLIRNQKSQKIDNNFTSNLATFSVCKEMKHWNNYLLSNTKTLIEYPQNSQEITEVKVRTLKEWGQLKQRHL